MERWEQAAAGRRNVLEGHDLEDFERCTDGAVQLLDALTYEDVPQGDLRQGGENISTAFQLADEAEQWQGVNPEKEMEKYDEATVKLREGRAAVGLPVEPMDYRGKWWAAFRRDNKSAVLKNLFLEQVADVGLGTTAVTTTKILVGVAKAHNEDEWGEAQDLLEDHYKRKIPAMDRKRTYIGFMNARPWDNLTLDMTINGWGSDRAGVFHTSRTGEVPDEAYTEVKEEAQDLAYEDSPSGLRRVLGHFYGGTVNTPYGERTWVGRAIPEDVEKFVSGIDEALEGEAPVSCYASS